MQLGYKKFLKYIFLFILLCGSFKVSASIINGTINVTNHTAQVCESAACTVSGTSPVNFGVFTTTPASNVSVVDTSLSGYIWGKSFGWAVLNCENTTSGCSVTNGNFKVANDYNGNLSGYAWGETSGWINFGPFLNSATTPVTINSSGQFNGYAWTQNHGWIKFDCSNPSYCVETDWRPRNTRPQCSDGIDNDGDVVIDSADSGCINNGVYDPTDNSELTTITSGCTINCNTQLICLDPTAVNFNGSLPCRYPAPTLCLDPTATNYNGSLPCRYPIQECTGPNCNPPPPCTTNCILPPPNGCTGLGCIITPPPIKVVIGKIDEILRKPVTGAVAKTVVAEGALFGVVMSFSTAIFANPLTFSEIFLIPFRLWSLLLSALGIKKRNRPWGIVYDSVTKQPLDPAYVILQDLQGNEVTTSITDLDGRYGFLVPAGQYRMIAHKTNYEFPSRKLSGKESDELYSDLYGGEIITVTEGGVITKNIPLDPLNFDWNEFAKRDQGLMKFYSKRDVWIARISNILFYFGFTLTIVATIVSPVTYNKVTLAVYGVLLILKYTILKPRPYGRLKYKVSSFPLSFAAIKVYSALTNREFVRKVSDKNGKYYCLVPNGTYYVKIEAKNPDQSYSPIYTSTPIEVKNGYINKKFQI